MLMAAAVLSGGCSVAFMDKPRTAQSDRGSCSKATAYLDSVGVGAAIATSATALIALDRDSDTQNVVVGTALMAGIFYLASADNGFTWAKECRAKK
jgi:hypothetical protein